MKVNNYNSMNKIIHIILLISIFLFTNCSNNEQDSDENTSTNNSKPLITIIDGVIFSVPSPYEFILFIKKLDIPYNHALLNPAGNQTNYTSAFKKCLNFGVYGIDLAYVTVFEQNSTALNYFSAVKSLSESIDLSEAFNIETIERLENNMNYQDSLLVILTNTYRKADKILKVEKQKHEAALIIAGSWIESLYLLTQIHKEKPSSISMQKIAEHKYYAENVLALLRPYYNNSEEFKNLIDEIVNICYQFDGISVNYTYKKPITYPELKKTIITSESKMEIYPKHLQNITEMILKLRNSIVK